MTEVLINYHWHFFFFKANIIISSSFFLLCKASCEEVAQQLRAMVF